MNEDMFRRIIKIIAQQMLDAAHEQGYGHNKNEDEVHAFIADTDTENFYKHYDITTVEMGGTMSFSAKPKNALAGIMAKALGECIEEYAKRSGDDSVSAKVVMNKQEGNRL